MSDASSAHLDRVLTWEAIQRLADERSWERAQAYLSPHTVTDLRVFDNCVSASVSGTELYRVELCADSGDALDYRCSCPAGDSIGFCKHCIAVGLYYLEADETEIERIDVGAIRRYLQRLSPSDLVEMALGRIRTDEDFLDRMVRQVEVEPVQGMPEGAGSRSSGSSRKKSDRKGGRSVGHTDSADPSANRSVDFMALSPLYHTWLESTSPTSAMALLQHESFDFHGEEAFRIALHLFRNGPNSSTYALLWDYSEAAEVEPVQLAAEIAVYMRAVLTGEVVPKHFPDYADDEDGTLLVDALLRAGDVDEAWEAAMEFDCDREVWADLITTRSGTNLDDSLGVWQELIECAVEESARESYAFAVRQLYAMKEALEEAGDTEEFYGYLTALRDVHGRKSIFLKMTERLMEGGEDGTYVAVGE